MNICLASATSGRGLHEGTDPSLAWPIYYHYRNTFQLPLPSPSA